MFQRKKISDIFTNEKYSLWYEESSYDENNHLRSRLIKFLNSTIEPDILAFSINYQANSSWVLAIDFKDEKVFKTFLKHCHEDVKLRLIPVSPSCGVVEIELHTRLPSRLIPCSRKDCYVITIADEDNKKTIIDNFLTAIHKTDSLDLKTLKKLFYAFSFLGSFTTLNTQMDLMRKFNKRLDNAYTRGSVMGLFNQLGYSAEIGYKIGTYLSAKDGRNSALTCKLAAVSGASETSHEGELIKKSLF